MEEKYLSSEDFAKVEGFFNKVMQLVRYNRTKDEAIERVGKEIQKYREGFTLSAFKALAMSIITYRENCKKELDDLTKYEYTAESLKKNFDFLIDDLKDILLENGVDFDDEGYIYNGQNVMAPIEFGVKKCECEQAECEKECECADGEACECAQEKSCDCEEKCECEQAECENACEAECEKTLDCVLEDYIKQITDILADNAKLEEMVNGMLKDASVIDSENKKLVIYPVFHALGLLKDKLDADMQKFPQAEENAKEEYAIILTAVIDKLLEILELLGVNVESENAETDKIVTGFHKLLKTVATDNPEDDRKIANVLSDAYTLEGKVIYPQKVEVYKYIKKDN